MNEPELAPIGRRGSAPGGPVFDEPWHAEVLAVANVLIRGGLFSSGGWAAALGEALRAAEARHDPDTQDTYHRAALAALEGLVAARSPETGRALAGRLEDRRRAYLDTPHGRPVLLSAGRIAIP